MDATRGASKMMPQPVMVRLDVEAMKYAVVHAFTQRGEELTRLVEEQVDVALKEFDFAKVVREAVDQALLKAVKDSVAGACSAILWESPLRDIIRDGAARKVREAIEASLS